MEIEPRPLQPDEREILDLLLSREFSGIEALRRNALEVVVVGRCDCGCPTVDLASTNFPRSDNSVRLAPVEGYVVADDGTPLQQLLLFVSNGQLRSLELVWYGDSPPARWPDSERVELVEIVR
jgi:hypothetical protein